MILLKTLINQLKIKNALLFHGATLSEGQAASIALVKAGFTRIPRGYLNFLNLSDGLAWNGLELFACGTHERAGTVFDQPTLVDYQNKYAKGHFFAKRLVLGRGLEYLVCYNATNHCYELVDRDSLTPMLKLPRFEDLLFQIISG